jgi:hypothetical protein
MYFFAGEMAQGTQIKVILNLPNGFQGLLKPYRFFSSYYSYGNSLV